MRFSLIHFHDDSPSTEVIVLTPGYEKTVFAVPLGKLDEFVPLVTEASRGIPDAHCPACGGDPLGPPRTRR